MPQKVESAFKGDGISTCLCCGDKLPGHRLLVCDKANCLDWESSFERRVRDCEAQAGQSTAANKPPNCK